MQIIKEGNKTPPDKIVYVAHCKTCGCVFTYMEDDIIPLSTFELMGLECPQCKYCMHIIIKRKYKGDVKNEK